MDVNSKTKLSHVFLSAQPHRQPKGAKLECKPSRIICIVNAALSFTKCSRAALLKLLVYSLHTFAPLFKYCLKYNMFFGTIIFIVTFSMNRHIND